MTKEELIKQCRYYKGEETCPEETNATMWFYERHWAENELQNEGAFDHEIDDMKYFAAQIPGVLNAIEKIGSLVPLSLLSVLFNRYMHWLGSVALPGFPDWVEREYLRA